ncbi:SCO4983 family protein, partial [Streptomyces zhihengii]
MYEPIRSKSVHSVADPAQSPHRSREAELDIQLAGHLAALLAVTDELGLDEAAGAVAAQVARLRGAPPARHAALSRSDDAALHRRAHALAGRALVVAASRADTAVLLCAVELPLALPAAMAGL